LGVAEIEAGGLQIGLRLRHGGVRLGDLRVQDVELLLGGVEPRLGGEHGGLRRLIDGKGLLCVLLRSYRGLQ
jgi:hypothetical protein